MKPNIFSDVAEKSENEIIDILSSGKNFRVERIVSHGQSSPVDFWFDQIESEWVLVIEGGAIIEFQNDELFEMHPGDYVFIPAHKKHRVQSTLKDKATIWLAFFITEEEK